MTFVTLYRRPTTVNHAVAITAGAVALAVAMGPLPYSLAGALGLAVGVLSLVKPELAAYLLIASVPVQDALAVPLGPTVLTANKLATILALVVLMLGALSRQLTPRVPVAAAAPVVAYLAVMWISTTGALSLTASLGEIYRWLQFLLVLMLASTILRNSKHWLIVAAIAVVAGAAEGALGLYQFRTGAGPESFAIDSQLSRAFGTFGMPNSYAGYLGQIFPLSLALTVYSLVGLFSKRSYGRRIPQLLLTATLVLSLTLTLGGLAASYSRGAWLAALASIFAMGFLNNRRIFLAFLLVVFVVAGALSLENFRGVPPVVSERVYAIVSQLRVFDVTKEMVTPENFAVAERMSQWQAGLNMFLANPLLGVGIGNYNAAYPKYFVGIWVFSRGHAHNYYINAAAETGILGLAAYLWLLGTWLYFAVRAARVTLGVERALAIGGLGALTALAVHNVVDDLHVLSMGVYQAGLYSMAVYFALRHPGAKA